MSKKPFDCIWLWNDLAERHPFISMGIDEALTNLATVPVLRIYRWSIPCISIGYFTSFKSLQESRQLRPIIRRWTGGGVVTHGQDLPFSLVVPRTHQFSNLRPSDSYGSIHSALLDALRTNYPLREDRLALSSSPSKIQSLCCFDNPVAHDILLDGTKIAGGGQKRTRKGFLHQGSLQLSLDHHPTPSVLANAMADDVQTFIPSSELMNQADELARCRYSTLEWTNKF